MEINKLKKLVPMPIKRLVYKSRNLSARVQLELETIVAQVNPKPIIVLGNQKSGTSAIAALLGEMTGKSFHIDMMKANERNIYEYVKTGRISFDEFIKLNKLEFSKEIVKEPNLAVLYGQINQYFPQAKFIFVVRDPRDNIRSILDRFKIPGNLQQMRPEDQRSLVRSWPSVFDGRWLGLSGENYIEMLAARWNYMADIFWDNQSHILLLKYEDFLQDKMGELARLAETIGITPVNDISAKVNIQYQPAGGNRNVKWRDFFGEDNLSRIELICGERMRRFEYQVGGEET